MFATLVGEIINIEKTTVNQVAYTILSTSLLL